MLFSRTWQTMMTIWKIWRCIFLHSVLWILLTLIFFVYTSASNSMRNRLFGRVLFSTCVGILLILWQRTTKVKPWFYLLLLFHYTLRQKLYFHRAFCNLPAQTRRERKRERKRAYYGNLAFGDRGPPYVVRGRRTFDSTLGFPGEGWQQLSIATWNTRSLTFERFKYCRSLQYDILAITELWRNQTNSGRRARTSSPASLRRSPKGHDKGRIAILMIEQPESAFFYRIDSRAK